MAYPNIAVDSSFFMTFSNIPGIDKDSTLKYFDDYVRSISVPAYNVGVYASSLIGHDELHPLQRENDELGEVAITFKASEDFMNYFILFNWMQCLRFGIDQIGDQDQFNASGPRLKRNVINSMDLFILNNQKNTIATMKFTNCIPTDLTGLDLNYGSDTEVEFSLNLRYENIVVNVPGSTLPALTDKIAKVGSTGAIGL